MQPSIHRRITNHHRAVKLLHDEWEIDRQDQQPALDLIIQKTQLLFQSLRATDNHHQEALERGDIGYNASIDVPLFALLILWYETSLEIVDTLTREPDGVETERVSHFVQFVKDIQQVMPPANQALACDEWFRLKSSANESLHRYGTPEFAIEEGTVRDAVSIIRRQRYHNMQVRGLMGDELSEYSDIDRYPGTLLGELLEPIDQYIFESFSKMINWHAVIS